MSSRDRLLVLLLPILWGFNFVVLDWGMSPPHGPSIPPLLFVAIRFFFVALPAVFFLPRPDAPFFKVAIIGVFMLLGQYGLLYSSMAIGMPAGLASLVLQIQVPLTILLASVALREQPSRIQIIGITLGVAGMVVVALGRGGHISAAALLLCLAAGVSWAIGNVLARALKVPGSLGLTVWSSTVVPIPLLLLSLFIDGPHGVADGFAAFGVRAALSTAYTVVLSTMVGFAIFNGMLSRYPSSTVVPWILLVPVVGIVSAWLCFGEKPHAAELIGGAIVMIGVLIAQGILRLHRQPATSAPTS